jgi:hypothetical protein
MTPDRLTLIVFIAVSLACVAMTAAAAFMR